MKIPNIKDYVLSQGSDKIDFFGGAFEGGIYLQQVPDEITEVLEFLINTKKQFTSMLEIGSASGGNAKMFYEILNLKELYIVDNNEHSKHTYRKENLKNTNYTEFIGNSQSPEAREWVKSKSKNFDIIYIDADHSYEGLLKDLQNYISFVKEDGYIIFHDTVFCEGVKKLVNQLDNYGLKKVFFTYHKLGITIFSK